MYRALLRSLHLFGIAALALTPALAACGDDDSAPPTAQQLASRLISVDAFDGRWTINRGPDDGSDVTSGVVPEDQRDMLPGIELCAAASAESRAAVDSLVWLAFRQIDLEVDDPIEPPADRAGHMVFVQEFLASGDADQLAATFASVRSGFEACLGVLPAGEEGPGEAETMAVPDVGDARFGVLTTVEEAGGWAEWRLHQVIVITGDVFMSFVVVDIRAGDGVEPFFSIDDIGEMVTVAVDRL
jgi:hypothetical protein